MEEKQTQADYIKGFNEGYLITRHLPELAQKLSAVESAAARVDGFKDGRQQYALDHLKQQRQLWAQRERNPQPTVNKDKGKELDKD